MPTDHTTPRQVASYIHVLAPENKWDQIQDELYIEPAVSIHPVHEPAPTWVKECAAIRVQGESWPQMVIEHQGGYCEPPLVAGPVFACTAGTDVKVKGAERRRRKDVAAYQVNQEGKIILEPFFY